MHSNTNTNHVNFSYDTKEISSISLLCFFLPYCFANQLSASNKIDKCGPKEITKDINKINQSVQYVYNNWDWEVTKDLITKSNVLIQYENHWIIYGVQNLENQSNLSELKSSWGTSNSLGN